MFCFPLFNIHNELIYYIYCFLSTSLLLEFNSNEGRYFCILYLRIYLKKLEWCLAHSKCSVMTTCWIHELLWRCCRRVRNGGLLLWTEVRTVEAEGDSRHGAVVLGTRPEISSPGGRTSTHAGQESDVRLGQRPTRNQHKGEAIPMVSPAWRDTWCDYLNLVLHRKMRPPASIQSLVGLRAPCCNRKM